LAKLGGKGGLFMPMRTGKTKVIVDWAGIAYHNLGLRRVLIVAPIVALDVWQSEIGKHSPVSYVVSQLRNSTVKNAEFMREMVEAGQDDSFPGEGIHWVLVNYEMVWRPVVEHGPRGGERKVPLDEIIAHWKPDLVVADEAHKIKQYTSRQSMALNRLGKAAPMRLALTGTPITKWPLDAYGLFRFADSEVFEQTKWRCWKKDSGTGRIHEHDETCEGFADHYATWVPSRHAPDLYEVSHYRNMPELTERIRAHSYAITLADAFPDLPERMPPQDIKVTLSPKARRIYDEMAKELIVEFEHLSGTKTALATNVLTKLVRLSQITSGFIKDELGVEVDIDDSKLRACMELIENIVEQDEKVVLFCRFVHDYHRLSEALATRKLDHAMLTGETKPKDRTANIARFQTSPSVPVFIAQMQSGSLGIDLSAARLSIFYSLGYNWAEYIQACERTLNPRLHRPLGIYRLLATRTIDIIQRRVMDERSEMAEAIIHNPRSLLDATD
jgi:SNF2 family DNA or RNA helicase